MNALFLSLSLVFNLQFAICNLQFAFLAVEDPVESGRESLDRWWGYPWYDSDTDGVKRIKVVEPWDWSWLRGLPLGAIVQWLGWIVLAAALIMLVYVLARMYLRRLKEPGQSAATAEEDPAARQRIDALPFSAAGRSDLLGEARRLYAAGDYNRAIVFLFSFQLVQLDRRQFIRLARGKTNRQYLRELGSRVSLRELLERTMVCFEDVFFGRHTLDRARFDSCWMRLGEFEVLAAE